MFIVEWYSADKIIYYLIDVPIHIINVVYINEMTIINRKSKCSAY